MWGRTSRGTRTVGLAAVSVVALSLTTSGPARAVDLKNPARGARAAAAVPSVCTVTGYRPNRITLGASPVSKTFSVQVTGCTLAEWLGVVGPFTIDDPTDISGVAGNFDLPTEDENGHEVILHLEPTISLDPHMLRNGFAGHPDNGLPGTSVLARGEEDAEDADFAAGEFDLTLQRRATFGHTFNASPEPVKKGKRISIKAKLARINWNGAKNLKYVGFANRVQVQFKPAGSSTFTTVKTVNSTKKGKVNTTVKAVRTGSWRLYFPGLSTTASATSYSDVVKVKK